MLKYLKFKYLILIIIILLISFYLLYNFRIYSLEIFNEAGLLFKYDYVLAIIFYCFFCIVFFYNIQNAKYLFIIYNFIIIYNIDNIYEFIDLKLAHFSIYNDHKFNFITTYENNIVIIKTWSEYVFIINSKISNVNINDKNFYLTYTSCVQFNKKIKIINDDYYIKLSCSSADSKYEK